MTLTALSMLLTVVLLCAVMAYRARLEHQQTLAWMRLLSANLGISSLTIAEPTREVVRPPAPPREVHKLSIPVPRGAMPRPIGGTSAEAIAQFNAAQRSAPVAAK